MSIYLVLIPLLFSMISFLLKGNTVKQIALAGSLILLAFTGYLVSSMSFSGVAEYVTTWNWSVSPPIQFSMGLDGLNVLLVLLTSVLLPLIILNSFDKADDSKNAVYGLTFLMVAAMNGVFIARDGLSFYIFWEMALIPIYFICAFWGGEKKIQITFKFFIYTFIGSLFMLVSLLYVYLQTPGAHSFDLEALTAVSLSGREAVLVMLGFFLGFAVKIPIFPFHSWQPDTYTNAPVIGTLLLSGIMLKMGTYGLMRWLVGISPEGLEQAKFWLITLSVIGIVYGSLIAITQRDMKRLFAWVSMAHVNLIAAGIFTVSEAGWQGALIQMFNHGVNIVGLFVVADIIEKRLGTRDLNELGGIASSAPRYAALAFIVLLGTIALPMTNGFTGEFLLLKSVYQYNQWLGFFATTTIILSAVYMFRVFQLAMFGNGNAKTAHFKDLSVSEGLVLGVVVFFILTVGLFPQTLLDLTKQSVEQLLQLSAG
ncbi:MAG TPA: NADH-quinone oxidoreductase subunit M [Saprospiraceae bacterium]|nr:NADH-quinone oxidoreductase subunit M [Saprospiraceae bacterium]HQW55348.1 NADH-quinone oxidoreductase subunit M [Saprospiraceae bacterium]